MEKLPEKFKFDSYEFTLLKREGDVALFQKINPAHKRDVVHYEVVIIQRWPAQTLRGNAYPEREKMPPSESWGTLGWSPYNLQAAQSRFDHEVSARKNPLSSPPIRSGARLYTKPLPGQRTITKTFYKSAYAM